MSLLSVKAIDLLEIAEALDQMGLYTYADKVEDEAYRFAQTSRLQGALSGMDGADIYGDDSLAALTNWGTSTGYNTAPFQRSYGPSLSQVEQSGAMPNPYVDGKPLAKLQYEQQKWLRGGNPYYGPQLQADSAMQSMYFRMLRKLAYYDAMEARGGQVPAGAREQAKAEYESYASRVGKNYDRGVATRSRALGSGYTTGTQPATATTAPAPTVP